MRHTLIVLFAVLSLAGCASKAPLSCDGSARRPINAPQQVGIVYPSCALNA